MSMIDACLRRLMRVEANHAATIRERDRLDGIADRLAECTSETDYVFAELYLVQGWSWREAEEASK